MKKVYRLWYKVRGTSVGNWHEFCFDSMFPHPNKEALLFIAKQERKEEGKIKWFKVSIEKPTD